MASREIDEELKRFLIQKNRPETARGLMALEDDARDALLPSRQALASSRGLEECDRMRREILNQQLANMALMSPKVFTCTNLGFFPEEITMPNKKLDINKVRITVSFLKDYTTMASTTMEQLVFALDGGDEIRETDVRHVVKRMNHDVNGVLNTFDFAKTIADGMAKKEMEEEITRQVQEKIGRDEGWKLRAEINELKRQLRQKSCQLDGVIKTVNPDYVPEQDQNDTQDLG